MTYVDGFVLPVPQANKEAYRKMAAEVAPIFRDHGAIAFVEGWGIDVPQGKVNCLNSAVLRKPDENVMFSWIVWPDRKTRDAGNAAVMADERMKSFQGPPPFDGQRMIFGGFEHILGDALAAPGAIIDGTLIPVPVSARGPYMAAAEKMMGMFCEHGASAVVDCWSEDVPEGKVNSFHTAVLRQPDEAIIFSWISWKDAATRDRGWEKITGDPRMAEFNPGTVGCDMGRMVYGTFEPIVVA